MIGSISPLLLGADSSNMSITLRAVAAGDEDFLFSVYASTRADEMARVDWTAEQQAAFLHMQFRAQSQHYVENYVGAAFQVILQNGQPAGRLYVHQRENEIRIMDIALLPEFRGQGIGATLLHDILAQGKNLNLPVTIHVEQFNPAMRLYQRLGFQPKEEKGVYLLMEWTPANQEQTAHV